MLCYDDVWELQGELKSLAKYLLARESNAQSLQPTALMLSALRRQKRADQAFADVRWEDRKAFFAAMYLAMQRALVDHARKRGVRNRVKMTDFEGLDSLAVTRQADPEWAEVLALAIERLSGQDQRLAEIVRHYFYADLDDWEIARFYEVSPQHIGNLRRKACTTLFDEIGKILGEE